jgi:hypothetical protein
VRRELIILKKRCLFALRFVRRLRGGSQPILIEATDGRLYVVKFANNLQGPNVLVNEGVGTELYRAFGLSAPKWRPLFVGDSFIDSNPSCWPGIESRPVRPSPGACFASEFLGGNDHRVLEFLPRNEFRRVVNAEQFWLAMLLDCCADHADNRQAIFLENGDRSLLANFIDHGHMFGGPLGQRHDISCPHYLDKRAYPPITQRYWSQAISLAIHVDFNQIYGVLTGLPDDWKTKSAIENIKLCAERLTDERFLHSVVEMIMDHLPANLIAHVPRPTHLDPLSELKVCRLGIQYQ